MRDPAVAAVLDARTVARLRASRDDNARFLDVLDALPRTVCHFDLHPANLFATAGGTTTVVDWASVGIGAVGDDPGNLVPDAVFDFHLDPAHLDALFDTVADGYAEGLGANATVDVDVRAAMALAMATKYVWIGPAIAQALHDGRELLNRRPVDDTLAAWLPTLAFVLDRADDARRAFGVA
jgi:thiamine kinase-like enzyme